MTGLLGRVTLEECLVKGHILNAYHILVSYFHHFIYQQHRIPVRQHLVDPVNVYDGFIIRVILRGQHLLTLFMICFDDLGKLHIGRVTRSVGNNLSLNRSAGKCQIAHYIKQFMAGGFIDIV